MPGRMGEAAQLCLPSCGQAGQERGPVASAQECSHVVGPRGLTLLREGQGKKEKKAGERRARQDC